LIAKNRRDRFDGFWCVDLRSRRAPRNRDEQEQKNYGQRRHEVGHAMYGHRLRSIVGNSSSHHVRKPSSASDRLGPRGQPGKRRAAARLEACQRAVGLFNAQFQRESLRLHRPSEVFDHESQIVERPF
jgi:hypothetical protein